MEIEIRKDDIRECNADDRGRIRLGPEYADKRVEVAVLDVREDSDRDEWTKLQIALDQKDAGKREKVLLQDKERNGPVSVGEERELFVIKEGEEYETIQRENMKYLTGERFEVLD